MKLNLDNYRVFRDICASSDHGLSLGAMGVLAYFIFGNARNENIDTLRKKSPDSYESVLEYVEELLEKGYLIDVE